MPGELSRGVGLRIRNDETVLVNLVQCTILNYVSVVCFQEKFDLKCCCPEFCNGNQESNSEFNQKLGFFEKCWASQPCR